MDCSLPGSSVLGILQARILEWVAVPFSRGSSQPRNQTRFSCIAGRLARLVKNLPAMQENLVWFLDWEDLLEKGKSYPLQYSGLENSMDCMGSQRVGQDWATFTSGEGNGNPLQYSCLENSMIRGAERAAVHGVTKHWAWLSTHTHTGQYAKCKNLINNIFTLASAYEIFRNIFNRRCLKHYYWKHLKI